MEHENANIDEELNRMRKEGFDKIAAEDLTVSQIDSKEKKLEEELSRIRQEKIMELTRDYPGRQLASHEDDEVRNAALDLLRERHQLSAIYMKDGSAEKIEDRLHILVPRAVVEWKSELLNLQLKELLKKFHDISGHGDLEEERRLQMQLNSLMKLRSEVAKNIGERILQPDRK